MKVLQINEKVLSGGAAVCMRQLHAALKAEGVSSAMLVARDTGGIAGALRMPSPSLLDRLCFHSVNLAGLNFAGMTGLRRITALPGFTESDVVHLHNLHGGYFNYRWLPGISRLKPVVWTLHDMWPVTGHCAHSLDCARWESGCGRCPYPRTYPAVRLDATGIEWRIKRSVYRQSEMVAVCPSRWLTSIVRESPLARFPVHHINNGVDTAIFTPPGKSAARQALGLPQDKAVIVFAADSLQNPFKDFGLLVAALQGMTHEEKARCVLLILGGGEFDRESLGGFHVVPCGYVDDDARKALVFGASDLMAYPSRADNQPLVILEAMACGCPVVSTAVGGIPELVRNGETGFLVDPASPESFLSAIRTALGSGDLLLTMSARCRRLATEEHDLSSCATRYADLYRDVVRRRVRTDDPASS